MQHTMDLYFTCRAYNVLQAAVIALAKGISFNLKIKVFRDIIDCSDHEDGSRKLLCDLVYSLGVNATPHPRTLQSSLTLL